MSSFPETGKVQDGFFKEMVFPFCGAHRNEVIVGPQYGVDVAIVNLQNGLGMALTSDPLSLIPTLGLRESAWLSVQLMANDIATTGYAPMYAQFTLNLPPTLSADDFKAYWQHIHEFCSRLGIAITGGHTGRFEGQNSTVAGGGTMITIAACETLLTSKGASPGDVLLMTKESALIATSILALSFPETVKKHCGIEAYERACALFYETSAVEAGVAAGQIGRHTQGVTAMHDVTEGGIFGAVYEMTSAAGCGVVLDASSFETGKVQQLICNHFGFDPRYSIGAGSMIIAVKPDKADLLIQHLSTKKIKARVIGKMTEQKEGMTYQDENGVHPLPTPGPDPYWQAFFNALKQGWK